MARVRIQLPQGEWFFDDARRLGRPGGFGEVFEGEDARGNPVAVKRLKLTAVEAAHRELAIAKELTGRQFDHVMAPLDSGHDAASDFYFVVMPRADRSLADEVSVRGRLEQREAVDVLLQIAAGLQELPNIVHRDLKPANVLLHEGTWKIADFGIARFVEDATSLHTLRECLTPPFAAPEQWNEERATASTDVYALGCVAHVLVSGTPPFPGPSNADYRNQHLTAAPPDLAAAEPRLRWLTTACLRKPAVARPALERVASVLRDILAAPAPVAPMAALQAVNAAEAQRASEAAARAERDRVLAREHEAIFETGKAVLVGLVAELERVVRENAPEATISRSRPSRSSEVVIRLGSAKLEVGPVEVVPRDVQFTNSRWHPVAIARVNVEDSGRNQWKHGATLWYMRLREGSEFRWYEVSYKHHAMLVIGPSIGPFPIQDLGNDVYGHADAAAGGGMHIVKIESGPTPIDDEAAEGFVQRWVSRFVDAYKGRLRPF